MKQKRTGIIFLAVFLALAGVAVAQSADYYLERVAIHARLVQSKLSRPESITVESGQTDSLRLPDSIVRGEVFRDDLARLLSDVEDWKSRLPSRDEATYEEVRTGLQKHIRLLKISAPSAGLDINQNTSLSLLLLEIEQASKNMDVEVARFDPKLEQPRNDTYFGRALSPGLGLNGWGGWNGWGPWGAGCDPWGPYFGRPLNPGFGPYCW